MNKRIRTFLHAWIGAGSALWLVLIIETSFWWIPLSILTINMAVLLHWNANRKW